MDSASPLSRIAYRVSSLLGLVRSAKNWLSLVAWNYLGREAVKTAVLRNGLRFRLRRRCADLSMMLETVDSGFYTRYPLGEGAIVDIGAHVGFFAVSLAAAHPDRKVYAFEPFPENHRLLVENVKLNRRRNVIVFRQAVGARRGSLPFYPVRHHSGCHSLFRREGTGRPLRVPVTTLASVFKNEGIARCALLKLDCEGAEFPIILNAPSSLFKRIDLIAMEYHDYLVKHELRELVGRLEQEGYVVERHPSLSFLYARRRR